MPTRKRSLFIGCIGVLLLLNNVPSQELKSGQLPPPQVPKAATIEIVLLSAPGLADDASKWEIAYEFRIINEAAEETVYFENRKLGKPGGRLGELIREADLKKPLRPSENHRFVLEIPFSPEIQERLKDQPRARSELPRLVTPEAMKLSNEQKPKFQLFKFYSVISIYDARLKKNILIPVDQGWDFANYPDARFGFKIEIKDDGSYQWKTTLPANARSPVMEIRQP